jgi:hypothetical protein
MEKIANSLEEWSGAWSWFLQQVLILGHYRAEQIDSSCKVDGIQFLGSIGLWADKRNDEDCEWLIECGLQFRDARFHWVFTVGDCDRREMLSDSKTIEGRELQKTDIGDAFKEWAAPRLVKVAELLASSINQT